MPDALDSLHRPLNDLRISVTDRCNFRCPYCMPAEQVDQDLSFAPRGEILRFEEITRLVRIFVRLGVSKVRITGGEPLLRTEVEALISQISGIAGLDDIALTTNGSLLAERAQGLKEAGLCRVTVSLDALDEAIFSRMCGREVSVRRVLEGIRASEAAGLTPIKVNTVVQRDVNDRAYLDVARHFHGTPHIVRFIEYMDVGSLNCWEPAQVVPAEEIVRTIASEMPIEPVDPNYRGEVAQRYRYLDGGGEIGVIASVTQPFCGDCTRSRVSTDGRLYTCLFAATGVDLRGPLRAGVDDSEIENLIQGVWRGREDRYSELRAHDPGRGPLPRRVEMHRIGG